MRGMLLARGSLTDKGKLYARHSGRTHPRGPRVLPLGSSDIHPDGRPHQDVDQRGGRLGADPLAAEFVRVGQSDDWHPDLDASLKRREVAQLVEQRILVPPVVGSSPTLLAKIVGVAGIGRRGGLKLRCPRGRVGSSPSIDTIS